MKHTHNEGVWDAPEVGTRYRDGDGRQFLVFSLTTDYIYVEYGSGEINVLCRPEWPRIEPYRLPEPAWNNGPAMSYAPA
ncbi:hypothetical protein [Endothiovibrio diazotrophicus]